jgi:hypothetical protein
MTAAATLSPVATQFLSDFEGFLDTAMTTDRVIDMSKVMGSYKLKPADVEVIRAKLEPRSDEMEVVALGFDPELDEAYSNLSKEKKREILAMYHTVLGFEVKGKARKVKSTKLSADGTFLDFPSGSVAPVAKTPKAKKEPKVPEVKAPRVGGKFTVALLPKYRMLMVYTDAVLSADGTKIDFETSYGVQLPKGADVADIKKCADEAAVTAAVSGLERIKNTPSTTVSKFATEFVTF